MSRPLYPPEQLPTRPTATEAAIPLTPGRRSAALRLLHDEAAKHLQAGLAPDRARFRVYALRDKLKLDVPDMLVEEALWLAAEEAGLL